MVALTFGMLPGIAKAQDFRGGVVGKVTDESGGVLPGVTVTATSRDTNVSSTAVTNDSGAYTLLYLTPGPYRVSAELQGFKKVQRENVEVRVGDRLEIDFRMEVGGLTEVVNVAAETPLERWRPRFPCVVDLPGQFFVKHNATHLGQLSAWRRAGGRPAV